MKYLLGFDPEVLILLERGGEYRFWCLENQKITVYRAKMSQKSCYQVMFIPIGISKPQKKRNFVFEK